MAKKVTGPATSLQRLQTVPFADLAGNHINLRVSVILGLTKSAFDPRSWKPRIVADICVLVAGFIIRMNDVRAFRTRTGLSQRECAALLGTSLETFRAWDSGRRLLPGPWAARLRDIAQQHTQPAPGPQPEPSDRSVDDSASVDRLFTLRELAQQLDVNIHTLRSAVRAGRLRATYGSRVVFGHPVPMATRADALAYRHQCYGRRARWIRERPTPATFVSVPANYDQRLSAFRRRHGLTQAQMAVRIGAAGKAVIYQWESRKRRPSSMLWTRVEALMRALNTHQCPPE
jgi:DNA-binding transcriptional regulator YiaG